MSTREVNFDGLPGPTHNYAGLAYGNLASTSHQGRVAHPRMAALQGLEKMRLVASLGIVQAVLPPLRRPHTGLLRSLGFRGNDSAVIDQAWKTAPELVAACFSASSMWTANAATVSPSADCADGKVHLTPANLSGSLHRSIEAGGTWRVLQAVFQDRSAFVVHEPLPGTCALSDEGAANHKRLAREHGSPGIELFVFGQSALDRSLPRPARFPARQTREASQAIARIHQLAPDAAIFVQQAPQAIDAGVFHNDVIAVGNESMLLCHEAAFFERQSALDRIRTVFRRQCGGELRVREFSAQELSLQDAVASYFFNSQLLTRPDGGMTLLCPSEVEATPSAHRCAGMLLAEDNPIDDVRYIDLRQSMNNGGGPACLRLRVVLTAAERARLHQGVLFNESLCGKLREWINRNYREELAAGDLRDPLLLVEVDRGFEELAQIMDLPRDVFECSAAREPGSRSGSA